MKKDEVLIEGPIHDKPQSEIPASPSMIVQANKLYTNRQYAILIGRSDARVSQLVRNNMVKTIQINGCKLIYHG